ncbi:glycosyltransferase [Salinimicrobium tongyeongense]|uniref:Glycosyltransferase n=1 Tax=Salinimicrobium tongyeongense TaxID=2809707 RepID=A0ABY6NRV0_9FLAO|nr:glycosyltransferase [Salinimicrobium tongyeongense]UZH55641.1 glycosyltransferase [Salinimicrobium tongyeongense]
MSTIISIIIPCYNNASYLDEALESVILQTFVEWECIILDDGSTDDTREVVKKWIKKDKRFKYKYQKNRGVSNARNSGIEQSNGEFILPLDADDKLSTNYLENCFNKMISGNWTVVYGKAIFFGDRSGEMKLVKPILSNLLHFNCIHCSGLFKKEDWKKIGGYDEKMKFGFEDWEFWINILRRKGKAALADKSFLYYRIKPNSRSEVINNNWHKENKMISYIFQKHIKLYGYKSSYELYTEKLKLEKRLEASRFNMSYKDLGKVLFQKLVRTFVNIIKI